MSATTSTASSVTARPQRSVLFFSLGTLRLGLLMEDVLEVVRAVHIEPLPGAPAVVEGVVNVRGAVLPVYDLRRRFDLPAKALQAADRLLVVRGGSRTALLRVDADVAVSEVDEALIDKAPLVGARSEVVTGAVKLAEGLLLLVDLGSFLKQAEQHVLDEALQTRARGT